MATVKVRSAADSASKWASRSGSASGDYTAQASLAGPAYAAGAAAAAPNYKASVTAGDIDRRFLAGVQRAGAAGYTTGIQEKGATRYSQGVGAPGSQSKYSSRVAPYLSVIASTDLPMRRPRGDGANMARAAAIATALSKARLAGTAAGR